MFRRLSWVITLETTVTVRPVQIRVERVMIPRKIAREHCVTHKLRHVGFYHVYCACIQPVFVKIQEQPISWLVAALNVPPIIQVESMFIDSVVECHTQG